MDFINHGIHGALIGTFIGWIFSIDYLYITCLCALLGMHMDIFGSKYYNLSHFGWLSKVLIWLPPCTIHLFLDRYTHGLDNRWYAGKFWEYFVPSRYREKMWVETVGTLVSAILLIIVYL